jgi:hypothetical protein
LQELGYQFVFKTEEADDYLADNPDEIAAIIVGPQQKFGVQFLEDFYSSGLFPDLEDLPVMYQHFTTDAEEIAAERTKVAEFTKFRGFRFLTGDQNTSNVFNQILDHLLDYAMAAHHKEGGIKLDTLKINQHKEGAGVVMKIDKAMIERFKRPDFAGFDFQIDFIAPLPNLPGYLGLGPNKKISESF